MAKTYLVSVVKTSEIEVAFDDAFRYLVNQRGYSSLELTKLSDEEVCELYTNYRTGEGAITPDFETHISCVTELKEEICEDH